VNGEFSKISRLENLKQSFELYRDNNEQGFNRGMKELLQCVELFLAHIAGSPSYNELITTERLKRIAIIGGKIDNCSIEYKENKDEWTRACKALLTNLSLLQTLCKLKEEKK